VTRVDHKVRAAEVATRQSQTPPPRTFCPLVSHFSSHLAYVACATGNESVPNVATNNTVKFIFKTAIGISLISNRDSFRVPFDKIAFVYFTREIYLHFSVGNGQQCASCVATLVRSLWTGKHDVNHKKQTYIRAYSKEFFGVHNFKSSCRPMG